MKKTLALLTLTALALCAEAAVFNFADFGGKGDNKTDNRTAFLKAFDALKKAPGSTLNIAPGTYRIGKEVCDFRRTGDFDTHFCYAEFDIT